MKFILDLEGDFLNNTQKIAIVIIGVVVVCVAAFAAMNMGDRENSDPTVVTESTVSFYFTDNLDNDGFVCTHVFPTEAKAIIPGIWVKGSGSDMESALKDACKTFNNASITVNNGKISEMNGVKDGNLYIWAWNGSEWYSKTSGHFNNLSDLDATACSYVAIVHGSTDKGGNAPAVNTTPSDIKWYYGDNIAPGKKTEVKFFVSNNFEYSKLESSSSTPSDPTTLLVPGIWIRGYADIGVPLVIAFQDALGRIGFDYNVTDTGFINYINDCTGGNFMQAVWDDTNGKWYEDTNEHFFAVDLVGEAHFAGCVYGAWGGETGYDIPPWPLQDATDCTWAY